MAEEGIDPIDEQIADGVLEMLGLVMDLVPTHVERPQQEQLEEAMATDDAQRQHPSRLRQCHSFIGAVRRQTGCVEGLEHARHRARRDVERRSDLAGRHRTPRLGRGDEVDRLHVVLDGQAGHEGVPGRRKGSGGPTVGRADVVNPRSTRRGLPSSTAGDIMSAPAGHGAPAAENAITIVIRHDDTGQGKALHRGLIPCRQD